MKLTIIYRIMMILPFLALGAAYGLLRVTNAPSGAEVWLPVIALGICLVPMAAWIIHGQAIPMKWRSFPLTLNVMWPLVYVGLLLGAVFATAQLIDVPTRDGQVRLLAYMAMVTFTSIWVVVGLNLWTQIAFVTKRLEHTEDS